MVITVTGSAGFIGSNFCHWLIKNTDHTVIGIDNLSTGYKENMPIDSRFYFYQADILDEKYLDNIFSIYEPDVCFHFAAYASEGRSNYIRSFIHQNNTVGTANIINICINHNCKLIFTSSVAVYSGEPPFDETTIPNPIDEYGLSKLMSEKSIEIAGNSHGLDWCIIRPRNVFGERQSLWDESRNVMGIWMYQILHDEPLTMFGKGDNIRTWTYIEDILEPLYNSIHVSKQIINLGSQQPLTVSIACDMLKDITGYKEMKYLEPRHEVKFAYCNTEKSKQLLNYQEKTSVYEGLQKMWQWAKRQPDRPKIISPKLEITKNLHSSII